MTLDPIRLVGQTAINGHGRLDKGVSYNTHIHMNMLCSLLVIGTVEVSCEQTPKYGV